MPRRRSSPAAPTSTATTRRRPSTSSRLHVVDPDDLAALDVDDLLVQQVRLAAGSRWGAGWNLPMSIVRTRRRAPVASKRGDVTPRAGRCGGGPVRDDEARDGRVRVADRDDQVRDRAERLAGRIAHRPADATAEEAHGGHQDGQVRPPAVAARRDGAGLGRQGAVGTWVMPAIVPAGLGPVSTWERSSYGAGHPEPARGAGQSDCRPRAGVGQTGRERAPCAPRLLLPPTRPVSRRTMP